MSENGSATPRRTNADLDPEILGSIIDELIDLISENPETTFPQALASYVQELKLYISIIERALGRPLPFRPQRDDSVAAWLKRRRDANHKGSLTWAAIDKLLDDYRLHADTGTPLEFDAHEGGHDDV